jgi:hypothetical protein
MSARQAAPNRIMLRRASTREIGTSVAGKLAF